MEKFRFWCQKVLPLVYDDSLSYYELLCKVVKYINDIIENMSEISKELEELVAQFNALKNYLDTHLEDAVSVVLEKWLADGKIEDLLNNILAQSVKFNSSKYAVYLHTQKIIDTKITDIAQGFCTDGTYFYMLHHADDDSPLKLLKMTKAGELVDDVVLKYSGDITVTDIHGNSLCYYNGFLYAAFAGDDAHNQNILKINPASYVCEKLTTSLRVSALCGFSDSGNDYFVNVTSGSQSIVMSYVKDGYMIPFSRYTQMQTVPNLKQGIHATGTHVYVPYSANHMYQYNMIRVYTHGLQNTVDIHLLEFNDAEMEDLTRFSGEETLYWNDIAGNVYSIDTTGVFTQSRDITSFSNYAQALPHYMVAVNANTHGVTDKVHTSNGVSIVTEINLPPCLRRTWSSSAFGEFELLGGPIQSVSVTPYSGNMQVNASAHVWNGTKYVPLFMRLTYNYDDTEHKLTLGFIMLSNADDASYQYFNNPTEANLQTVTAWVKEKFGKNLNSLLGNGYLLYNTSLNAGSVNPLAL